MGNLNINTKNCTIEAICCKRGEEEKEHDLQNEDSQKNNGVPKGANYVKQPGEKYSNFIVEKDKKQDYC